MTYRSYIIFIFLCTFASMIVWFWVVSTIGPDSMGIIGIALFYTSLGLTMLGSMTLGGMFVRRRITRREELRFYVVRASFRQGFLITLFALLSLVFQHIGYLTWWNFLILLLFFMSLELFFASSRT